MSCGLAITINSESEYTCFLATPPSVLSQLNKVRALHFYSSIAGLGARVAATVPRISFTRNNKCIAGQQRRSVFWGNGAVISPLRWSTFSCETLNRLNNCERCWREYYHFYFSSPVAWSLMVLSTTDPITTVNRMEMVSGFRIVDTEEWSIHIQIEFASWASTLI